MIKRCAIVRLRLVQCKPLDRTAGTLFYQPRTVLMQRTLSSYQTILVKFVLPMFWIPIFGGVTMTMFVRSFEEPMKWMFLLIWISGSVFFLWDLKRLKAVSVDDDFLYVSNYLKEITIPLSDIYDVTENVWLNSHPVTIHLKFPSEFGDKIVFMPKPRFSFFSSHPVVNELKQLARSKVARR